MAEILADKIETIISTLLHVGDRVLEVSSSHVIRRVWDKEDSLPDSVIICPGMKVSDIFNGHFIAQCNSRIEEAFVTQKSTHLKFTIEIDDYLTTYNVRMVPIHPDKDFLFVVIENLSKKTDAGFAEDGWKLALDAVGDGMWELNVETDEIFFSAKWH